MHLRPSPLTILATLTVALMACQLLGFVTGFFLVLPAWAVMVVILPVCLSWGKRGIPAKP